MRHGGTLIVALACLAPLVLGDAPANPQMPGGPSPVSYRPGYGPLLRAGAPEVAIVAAWVDQPNASYVRVSWQVQDVTHKIQSGETLGFSFLCRSGTDGVGIAWDTFMGGAVLGSGIVTRADGSATEYAPAQDGGSAYAGLAGNVAWVSVPRVAFSAPICTQPFAVTQVLVQTSPRSWQGFLIGDTAPQMGYGTDIQLS